MKDEDAAAKLAALAAFEERMKKKAEKEAEAEKLKADQLRSSYLKRTGRTEMKP